MEWTYTWYTVASYCIPIGVILIIMTVVFVAFYSSRKGKEFVQEKIVGVDLTKAEDDEDADNGTEKDEVKTERCVSRERAIQILSFLLCSIGIGTLAITVVLLFQGCALANTRVVANDNCPEYPVDCFILNKTGNNPISDHVSFRCDPLNTTQFPSNMTDTTAQCFGWIILEQTTKNVLDQLGVCTGLISLFTTLLAALIYLGRCIKTIVLSLLAILCCVGALIPLVVFKVSYAPLTYAVLGLGTALGVFGIFLFCILPKRKKKTSSTQASTSPTDQTNSVPNPTTPLTVSSSSAGKKTVSSAKIKARSPKITPTYQ